MIAFCDPGLANTAVIAYDERARVIVAAATFTTPADGPTPGFAEALERAETQAARVADFMDEHRCTLLVAEAYEDIPGPQRGAKHRWSTPLVCSKLDSRCDDIEWQSPRLVMTRYREHVATWKAHRFGIVKGDTLLTNPHLRSAGAHLLAWEDKR